MLFRYWCRNVVRFYIQAAMTLVFLPIIAARTMFVFALIVTRTLPIVEFAAFEN